MGGAGDELSPDRLVRKLATFARILRAGGLEIGPHRIQDALQALSAVGPLSRDRAYWALRCTLTSRCEDVEVFDAAFEVFWGRSGGAPLLLSPSRHREPGSGEGGEGERTGEQIRELLGDDDEDAEEGGDTERGLAWSAIERLREMDFADYGDRELREAERLVERIAKASPLRRSRRLRPAGGGQVLDKRRTLRAAMRTDGYPLVRLSREPRLVPRKLLYVVDVSGSMEPYARAMVMFLHASVRAGRRVEAFTLGTRLTRITPQLTSHDSQRALRAAARAVPDWAGGTRIGENLKALNDGWGRRGVTRGAVAVILSDGWERGDPGLLGSEMERLARVAHTVVWVNPLAGEPGYEPLAQGMAAALPHVDTFLPGHNLRSLEALAAVLEGVPLDRRHAGRVRSVVRG